MLFSMRLSTRSTSSWVLFLFLSFCLLVFDCMSAPFNAFLCACGRIVVLLAAVMLSRLERRCLVFRPRDLVSLRLGLASYSLRKQPTFRWFPLEITSEKPAQKFPTDDASLPRSVLLIGLAAWEICFNQSEVLPRSG